MPKPRNRSRKYQARSNAPAGFRRRQRREAQEDFVGKFVFSTAVAFIAALINQAVANQVNWLIVLLAFLLTLILLTLYDRSG